MNKFEYRLYLWILILCVISLIVALFIGVVFDSESQNGPIVIPSLTPSRTPIVIPIEPLTAPINLPIFYPTRVWFNPPTAIPTEDYATPDWGSIMLSQEPPQFP